MRKKFYSFSFSFDKEERDGLVKVRGQNSNGMTVKQMAKQRHVPPAVIGVDHPRSHDWFEMFESLHERRTILTLMPAVEFMIIPQPPILDARRQWRHIGRICITWDSLATLGSLIVFQFEFWPRTFIIKLLRKKSTKRVYKNREWVSERIWPLTLWVRKKPPSKANVQTCLMAWKTISERLLGLS